MGLEGVIDRGSRGIDQGFSKHPVGAGPVQYSDPEGMENRRPQTYVEEAPPLVQIQPWEVLSSQGKMADSNGSVGHYEWKVIFRNNTDAELVLAGDVDLVDSDGHIVEEVHVSGLHLPARADQEFTGQKMVMADSSNTITGPRFTAH